MFKTIVVHSATDALALENRVLQNAATAITALKQLVQDTDPIRVLEKLKFKPIGHDPLDTSRALNFTEQINQTFTYLTSFEAAMQLFKMHPQIRSLTMNIGTQAGPDLASTDQGGVVAEVFSSVLPTNNRKLQHVTKKVFEAKAAHKYVFFLCPGFSGEQPTPARFSSVRIIAIGLEQIAGLT